MIDITELAAEIENDPQTLGYAAPAALGDCTSIAAKLNAKTGSGAASIARTSVGKGDLVQALLPVAFLLPTLTAAKQAVWGHVLAMLNGSDGAVRITQAVSGALAAAQADGLLTAAQAGAITHRTGSRAEVLWGDGAIVTDRDVAEALRS